MFDFLTEEDLTINRVSYHSYFHFDSPQHRHNLLRFVSPDWHVPILNYLWIGKICLTRKHTHSYCTYHAICLSNGELLYSPAAFWLGRGVLTQLNS
jgi:hypothetical protein